MDSETIFGFCPWEDGEGELWGRVLELSETGISFQEIDPLGRDTDISEHEFDSIIYIDDNPSYAQRLAMLRNFNPTLPSEVTPITTATEIRENLTTASISDEVIRISFPGTSLADVTVDRIAHDWIEITNYNNLMLPTSSQVVRIDSVSEFVWRDATCQCETYLRSLTRNLSEAAGPSGDSHNLN